MALPTFLLAGAQRCGTTTMYRLLKRHPEIYLTRPKELHFFDMKWELGLDWYEAQFKPRPRHKQLGEATPIYMYDGPARERMIETLPDVQLLIMLRNPIDRAYSHYLHMRARGHEKLDTFEAATAKESKRLSRDTRAVRRRYSYVDRGHFIVQLEALEAAYGRDRMHVMLLEDLKTDRTATLEAAFRFLDLDPEPASSIEEKWANRQPQAVQSPMQPATRAKLAEHYRVSNQRLGAWLGRDLSHWK
jgi:hypothetical protein